MAEQDERLSDSEISDLADDYKSTFQHGGTTFDEFDWRGFAAALIAADRARAAISTPAQPAPGTFQAPPHFKIVPEVPTQEMVDAFRVNFALRKSVETCYSKMLDAAPELPAQPAAGEATPAAWIWKHANGEEEVVFVDAAKVGWDPEEMDVPSKVTPLYAAPQPAQVAEPCVSQNAESEPQAGLSITGESQQVAEPVRQAGEAVEILRTAGCLWDGERWNQPILPMLGGLAPQQAQGSESGEAALRIARGAIRELERKVFGQEQAMAVMRTCLDRHQRDEADPPGYLQDAVIKAAGIGTLAEELAAMKRSMLKVADECIAANDQRDAALRELIASAREVRSLLYRTPAMQSREYIGVGIRFVSAIDAAAAIESAQGQTTSAWRTGRGS